MTPSKATPTSPVHQQTIPRSGGSPTRDNELHNERQRTPAFSDGNFVGSITYAPEPWNIQNIAKQEAEEERAVREATLQEQLEVRNIERAKVVAARTGLQQHFAEQAKAEAAKLEKDSYLNRAFYVATVDEAGRRRAVLGQSLVRKPNEDNDERVQFLQWLNVTSGRVSPPPKAAPPPNVGERMLSCILKCVNATANATAPLMRK